MRFAEVKNLCFLANDVEHTRKATLQVLNFMYKNGIFYAADINTGKNNSVELTLKQYLIKEFRKMKMKKAIAFITAIVATISASALNVSAYDISDGDIISDSVVNVFDAIALKQQSINGSLFSEDIQYLSADLNNDLEINLSDDKIMREYLFGNKFLSNTEKGWIDVGDYTFFYMNGSPLRNTVSIYGTEYTFSADGSFITGWVNTPYGYQYRNEYGALCYGWQTINNKVYYFADNGYYLTSGLTELDGKLYFFNENGEAINGWKTIDGKLYFFNKDRSAVSGFATVQTNYYYFSSDCTALSGLYNINGNYYYFSPENYMAVSGLMSIDGKTYYFGNDKTAVTGLYNVNGNYYYFDSDRTAVSGLYKIGSSYYFFGQDGIAVSGFQKIGGKYYYFSPDDFSAATGFVSINGDSYLFSDDGSALSGWQIADGSQRYFYPDTYKMAVNTTVDGITVDSEGKIQMSAELIAMKARANEVFAVHGTTPYAIYSFVRSNNKYKYIEETKSLSQIENYGWLYFAEYAMNNKYVVCYYFAALQDFLFQEAGLTSRIVYDTGRGSGDHYWNQVYVDGTWLNYDACNGYAAVSDTYLKNENYTWYQYVYPEYK